MSAEATIRDATAMDAEAIGRIHVETWRSTYPGLVPSDYLVRLDARVEAERWREGIGRRRLGRVLVAELPGAGVVGFGSCGVSRSADLPYRGEIYTLYIAPDWHNQGLGRRLVGGLFEELAADGRTSAFLWVLSGNPTRYFYEAIGGQAVAERAERFAGSLLDETAYAWPDLVGWLKNAKGRA